MNISAENVIQRTGACMYAVWESVFLVGLLPLEKYNASQRYNSKPCVNVSRPGEDVIQVQQSQI